MSEELSNPALANDIAGNASPQARFYIKYGCQINGALFKRIIALPAYLSCYSGGQGIAQA